MPDYSVYRGTQPKFKTPAEMQTKIDEYFESCEGEILRDADDNPMIDRQGQAIIIGAKPPTIAGLTRALGFTNKNALNNYHSRRNPKEFITVIEKARLRIEEYNESRLYDRDGAKGAELSLRVNFGWNSIDDKKKEGESGARITIINDVPRTAPVAEATPAVKPEEPKADGE